MKSFTLFRSVPDEVAAYTADVDDYKVHRRHKKNRAHNYSKLITLAPSAVYSQCVGEACCAVCV